MTTIYVELRRCASHVLTPDGMFRLSNPEAICPGRLHLVSYHPFGRWATIIAIECPQRPRPATGGAFLSGDKP